MKKIVFLFLIVGLGATIYSCEDKQENFYQQDVQLSKEMSDSIDCVNKGCVWFQSVCNCGAEDPRKAD